MVSFKLLVIVTSLAIYPIALYGVLAVLSAIELNLSIPTFFFLHFYGFVTGGICTETKDCHGSSCYTAGATICSTMNVVWINYHPQLLAITFIWRSVNAGATNNVSKNVFLELL